MSTIPKEGEKRGTNFFIWYDSSTISWNYEWITLLDLR